MTNRKAFNEYVRNKIEEQLKGLESMTNVELLSRIPGLKIQTHLTDDLNHFIYNKSKEKIRGKEEVLNWLSKEQSV